MWLLPKTVKQREYHGIPLNASVREQPNRIRRDASATFELTSIVLRPEPFDDKVERRCKHAWEQASCPDCGKTVINAGDSSPGCGVLTAAIRSHTLVTRRLRDEHSRLERSCPVDRKTAEGRGQ